MGSYVILSGTPEPCVFYDLDGGWRLFIPETAQRRHFNQALILPDERTALRTWREIRARSNVLDRTAWVLDLDLMFDEDGNYLGWESIRRRLEVAQWNIGTKAKTQS